MKREIKYFCDYGAEFQLLYRRWCKLQVIKDKVFGCQAKLIILSCFISKCRGLNTVGFLSYMQKLSIGMPARMDAMT